MFARSTVRYFASHRRNRVVVLVLNITLLFGCGGDGGVLPRLGCGVNDAVVRLDTSVVSRCSERLMQAGHPSPHDAAANEEEACTADKNDDAE